MLRGMPTPASIERIDAYWRTRGACDEADYASGSTRVTGFPADPRHNYNVIAMRRMGGGCIVLVHDHLLPQIAHFAGFPADETFDKDRFTEAYARRDIKFVLLAAQAYADAGDLRDPGIDAGVRTIDGPDDPALGRLHAACGDAEWFEASMGEAQAPIFATFADGEIAGLAHGIARDGLRHAGVLTHPAQRGRGQAKAAAYAMARHFAAAGEVVQWQARRSNKPSLAARDALGFIERYRTIMLRVE